MMVDLNVHVDLDYRPMRENDYDALWGRLTHLWSRAVGKPAAHKVTPDHPDYRVMWDYLVTHMWGRDRYGAFPTIWYDPERYTADKAMPIGKERYAKPAELKGVPCARRWFEDRVALKFWYPYTEDLSPILEFDIGYCPKFKYMGGVFETPAGVAWITASHIRAMFYENDRNAPQVAYLKAMMEWRSLQEEAALQGGTPPPPPRYQRRLEVWEDYCICPFVYRVQDTRDPELKRWMKERDRHYEAIGQEPIGLLNLALGQPSPKHPIEIAEDEEWERKYNEWLEQQASEERKRNEPYRPTQLSKEDQELEDRVRRDEEEAAQSCLPELDEEEFFEHCVKRFTRNQYGSGLPNRERFYNRVNWDWVGNYLMPQSGYRIDLDKVYHHPTSFRMWDETPEHYLIRVQSYRDLYQRRYESDNHHRFGEIIDLILKRKSYSVVKLWYENAMRDLHRTLIPFKGNGDDMFNGWEFGGGITPQSLPSYQAFIQHSAYKAWRADRRDYYNEYNAKRRNKTNILLPKL